MDGNDIKYAGFWIRLGATLIDNVLFMAIIFALLLGFYGWDYFVDPKAYGGLFVGPGDFLIQYVFPFAAAVWFWRARQATPGKMALRLRILDAKSGQTLSTGQCVIRYFAYLVSIIPLGLGFVWIAFDSRKQGWHDKLAGSVVVRSKRNGSEPIPLP